MEKKKEKPKKYRDQNEEESRTGAKPPPKSIKNSWNWGEIGGFGDESTEIWSLNRPISIDWIEKLWGIGGLGNGR